MKKMVMNKLNLVIGGEAGYGIMNTGLAFAKFSIRNGLYAFLSHEYPSLVRGGHNTSAVRVSDSEIGSHHDKLSILIALNEETIEKHYEQLEHDGILIYDKAEIKELNIPAKGIQLVDVPFVKISTEICNKRLLSNSVALGATVAVLNGELKIMNGILKEMYEEKGKEIIEWNLKACKAGYDSVKKNFHGRVNHEIKAIKSAKKCIITGNEAIGLGALAAGCKFHSQYPMTPTTQLLTFMALYGPKNGAVVVQPEDEISSIHMAIGASFAGVRAMCATAGGGFCLMSEGFGLAGITEIPIVVVVGQRAGPATGLPTKTEQSDLNLALHSGQGEIARIVIAPSDVEDAFYSTIEAFELADKFQVPAILLPDKYLCVNGKTTEKISCSDLTINRGKLISDKQLSAMTEFKRYSLETEDGVSYRSIPGQKNGMYDAASDEHNEFGQIVEDSKPRTCMMEKRMKKIPFILKDLSKPELIGDKNADITLIGWGSTKSAIEEAMDELRDSANLSVNHLHVKYLSPFQSDDIKNILSGCKKIIIIEGNYTSQLASLIREKTGIEIKYKINRYDGKQFTSHEIYKKVMEVLGNGISGTVQNKSFGGAQWQI